MNVTGWIIRSFTGFIRELVKMDETITFGDMALSDVQDVRRVLADFKESLGYVFNSSIAQTEKNLKKLEDKSKILKQRSENAKTQLPTFSKDLFILAHIEVTIAKEAMRRYLESKWEISNVCYAVGFKCRCFGSKLQIHLDLDAALGEFDRALDEFLKETES